MIKRFLVKIVLGNINFQTCFSIAMKNSNIHNVKWLLNLLYNYFMLLLTGLIMRTANSKAVLKSVNKKLCANDFALLENGHNIFKSLVIIVKT